LRRACIATVVLIDGKFIVDALTTELTYRD
jgi:hypothetical protein